MTESNFSATAVPIRFIDEQGRRVAQHGDYAEPAVEDILAAYRWMVIGRQVDDQVIALARQGRLVGYPPISGQEACQVAAGFVLRETDWIFPTYRDSLALFVRGLDPAEVLASPRGNQHCGYDSAKHRSAPQATPLATQIPQAAGFGYAERRRGADTVVLACIGDGATSEGDFHEGLNFAAVFGSPLVCLVQNNQYAISTPLERQTAATTLAAKGAGYGVKAEYVDGNDVLAMLSVLTTAVEHARTGGGPFLVEALTYRFAGHSIADDPSRYRTESELESWRKSDPIPRAHSYLRSVDALTEQEEKDIRAEADAIAAELREEYLRPPALDPLALFDSVYATPPPHVNAQRAQLLTELAQAPAPALSAPRQRGEI